MKTLRKIPVVESLFDEEGVEHKASKQRGEINRKTDHEGGDAVGEQTVNKLVVELDALRVDGVVATAEGDDSSPCDGEAVCLDAVLLEEGDVVLPAGVRVGRDVAVTAVEGLAWRPAEIVPDGLSATVDVGRAFDLECGCTRRSAALTGRRLKARTDR